MSKKIVQYPNIGLKSKANKVDAAFVKSKEFKDLLTRMNDAMLKAGGIGIAAPQIGEPYQVAIIKPDFIEPAISHLHILINPTYAPLTNSLVTMDEGCLSVDHGHSSRPIRRFSAVDVINEVLQHNGRLVQVGSHVSGFLARIVQHEVQHLHGYLIVDEKLGLDNNVLNLGK